MNSNYFEIDGKYYAIDLEKVMEFITNKTNNEEECSQNTVNTFAPKIDENGVVTNEIVLMNKEISETKNNSNETALSIRTTLINSLLNIILTPISDGAGSIILTESFNQMHIGQKFALNTLIGMDIIYEIEIDE